MYEDQMASLTATVASELIATSASSLAQLEEQLANFVSAHPLPSALVMYVLLLWLLVWKGLALWRASQRQHKFWFIFILALNTLSIFELLYYFYLSKVDWQQVGQKLGLSKKEA